MGSEDSTECDIIRFHRTSHSFFCFSSCVTLLVDEVSLVSSTLLTYPGGLAVLDAYSGTRSKVQRLRLMADAAVCAILVAFTPLVLLAAYRRRRIAR